MSLALPSDRLINALLAQGPNRHLRLVADENSRVYADDTDEALTPRESEALQAWLFGDPARAKALWRADDFMSLFMVVVATDRMHVTPTWTAVARSMSPTKNGSAYQKAHAARSVKSACRKLKVPQEQVVGIVLNGLVDHHILLGKRRRATEVRA